MDSEKVVPQSAPEPEVIFVAYPNDGGITTEIFGSFEEAKDYTVKAKALAKKAYPELEFTIKGYQALLPSSAEEVQ